ncbi:putative transmembrane protein [Serpentovirinae sp. isolate L25]|uniref:Transmembrane protein n=1 Tax=Serpentovirinae sp. isolate L25 TaxID=3071293 RepID=A0AAE6TVG8_9NIDO|nr:putative transmembrane protein [Serpentovirinae sp.]QFU19811.1 putative transmembrane protein [Serpentovirinae sp.]
MSFILDALFKVLALIILHQLLSFYIQHAEANPLQASDKLKYLMEPTLQIEPVTGERYCCGTYGHTHLCLKLNGYEQCSEQTTLIPSRPS